MKKDRINYLYTRYIADNCTHDELRELEEYLSDKRYERYFRDLLDESWTGLPDAELTDIPARKAASLLREVMGKPRIRQLRRRRWLHVAAAVVLTVSAAGLWFHFADTDPLSPASAAPDALPGGNKATLTMAGGRTIDLSPEQTGIIAGQHITYADGTEVSDVREEVSRLMSLSTPKGGQYQILLSDGTKVWLNAASSLRYPAVFTGEHREVQIEGEVYFEVNQQSGKPFIVTCRGQQVQVLGTSFIISAYPDESAITTTLVTGSVKVSTTANSQATGRSVVLKPGQQAAVIPGRDEIQLNNIDILAVMAWKDELFVFNDEPIRQMMKRLSRWYDVEVVYKGNVDDVRFLGNYSRNKSLGNLLKNIEQTGKVRFETTTDNAGKERRIMVIAE